MSLLSVAQAGGLFAVCAALLLLLFFLRRKARLVIVPSLEPWRERVKGRVNPLWREIIALLLQLLAAGLLCAALVEAEPDEAEEASRRVLVVDASPSMAPRMESAAALARALEAGLVLAGQDVQLLASPSDSPQQREAGLRRAAAGNGEADLELGVALARELGFDPIVVSDRDIEGLDVRIVGDAAPDVSIDEVAASAGPGLPPEYAIRLVVVNHDAQAREVEVQLESATAVLGVVQLSIGAGERLEQTFRMDPVEGDWVLARLVDHEDSLPANDQAYALLPSLRPARAWLVSDGNRYLEDVLRLMPGLELRVLSPDAYRRPPSDLDLVIFDRVAPAGRVSCASVYLDPPPASGPFPPVGRASEPEFTTWDYTHQLLRGVTFRHLAVEEVSVLSLPRLRGRVIASTDDGPAIVASAESPPTLAVGFDLRRSDLPLTVAFPQLVYNLLLWARQDATSLAPGLASTTADGIAVDPGAPVRVQRVDAPGAWDFDAGISRVGDLSPGVYRVEDRTGERLVALRYPPDEHATMAIGEAISVPAEREKQSPTRPPHVFLALGALGILLTEFLVAPR
ncbi:MAG TPA: hypothetical protein QGF58_10875 [Myxococcota bacterium]|nr:hypothetical protein [Myxococcota bacterium]